MTTVTAKKYQRSRFLVWSGSRRIGGYDCAKKANSVAKSNLKYSVTFKSSEAADEYINMR